MPLAHTTTSSGVGEDSVCIKQAYTVCAVSAESVV